MYINPLYYGYTDISYRKHPFDEHISILLIILYIMLVLIVCTNSSLIRSIQSMGFF